MSNPSESSTFEKNPGKKAEQNAQETVAAGAPNIHALIPAEMLPSAADALAAIFPPQETVAPNNAAAYEAAKMAPLGLSEDIDNLSVEKLESLFPSLNGQKTDATAAAPSGAAPEQPGKPGTPAGERRSKRRALISAPVRVRSNDLTRTAMDEVTTTVNVSRIGILLATHNPAYYRSMEVMVTFPHSNAPSALQAEQPGRVVRLSEMLDGRRSVAIALGVTHRQDEDYIAASGEKLHSEPKREKIIVNRDPKSSRPLVVALDADAGVRESMKTYLTGEGYDVIAVATAQEARDVLDQCTPALLIAEIEGAGMPGYDICSHCKATPRLQGVPVMLTTSSAYPSDYASAHSLGAVVCMAKPYRQERLGHVVRLLAPPPNANDNPQPPRAADPSRRHLGSGNTGKAPESNVDRRFRFGRKS